MQFCTLYYWESCVKLEQIITFSLFNSHPQALKELYLLEHLVWIYKYIGKKKNFDFINIVLYLNVEFLHHGYWGLTTGLYKRCPYRFTDIPPRYHHITSDFLAPRLTFRRTTTHFTKIVSKFFQQVIILLNLLQWHHSIHL